MNIMRFIRFILPGIRQKSTYREKVLSLKPIVYWNIDRPEREYEEAPGCVNCGKELEDFSDIGCEYCDTRHHLYGKVP